MMAVRILEGNIPNNLDRHTKILLNQIQQVREPMNINMSFQDMKTGFNKWREQTTTSPSNKHLGIYKALLSAVKNNIYTPTEQENETVYNTNKQPTPTAETALLIQYQLMIIAIRECHTYKRWQVVHNFLIEKLPGLPLINKLRVIHIYEADWSLIQRFYVAYKLSKKASDENTVTTEQAGARPERSAIELALNRVLTYETIRNQQLTGAIMYNYAKACYDRVIENFSNLALLREGLPQQIAKLHAQTFKSIQYHIKHKLGIETITHSHNQPLPIYGVGQGSTDASARWSFLSDAIIRAYNETANNAIIKSPISNKTTNNKINAFVDDTTTLIIKQAHMAAFLLLFLQQDAQLWERFLYITGGKLEIPKCNFALFQWYFDNMGRANLLPSNQQCLHVKSSETNTTMHVPQIEPSQAYKYVGVHIALNGNMTTQIQHLKEKCNKINSAMSQVFMSPQDTKQGFTTVFIPAIRYSLPATTIQQKTLVTMQKPIINTVLTKLGYNRHMPRAVVFAPTSIGGIGLLDLYMEQGTGKIIQILSQLRSHSPIELTILILLETYQICAGITYPALENNTITHNYINSPWVQTTKLF
jgi:hypothetical protein